MIPYGRQSVSDDDIAAVTEVLRSDWLTQGPAVTRFEESVAAYCGARHAVAVSNGTTALHAACAALELGPGDWLWTSPITFVASANCALYCGARVDFVDVEPGTRNICVDALSRKLEVAAREKRLPKVVIAVHFSGLPCDMPAIAALADQYGFKVIEDAAHAIGSSAFGSRTGACEYSDLTTFSFHPVKVITTGEGGMITTRDDALAAKVRLLCTHGITRDSAALQHPEQGGWYYEQQDLGWNFRITDMQAALGISQLTRLDHFVARRTALASRYAELLADLPLTLPAWLEGRASAWHLYPISLTGVPDGMARRQIYDRMRSDGVGVNVHYIPVYHQPYYAGMGFDAGQFPVAEAYYRGALSLPLFPDLTEEQQDSVVQSLKSALASLL